MKREFSSGSRQAPDPLDKFLEEHNYYRKHTARDASCLFRVISEQIYDTQMHHLEIRRRCVLYMRKHRELFQTNIKRDIDDYLDDMSKPKTYGTLIELQAVGYLFQWNVLIFEPFNLGTVYVNRSEFKNTIRVFYTPERHFDSVYTSDFIEDVAVCQSICYEILYKDFFKIADVSYAVERMLHQSTFDVDHCDEYNETGYSTRMNLVDGQSFEFDLPNETNCILENYKLCHFHNKNFSTDLQRQLKLCTHSNKSESEKDSASKNVDSVLPQKYISCVRQLLEEGITPFPYKVAKALDPSMYRNIEFDAWNEARKEMKLQNWYNGDTNFKRCIISATEKSYWGKSAYQRKRVHAILQVGAKCNVKLCKSETGLYTCHIQEISQDKGCCVVFVEQLGEKRVVSYDSLSPLPPEQFKPWTLPYRFQRHMQKYSSFRLMRQYNCRWKLNRHPSNRHYNSSLANIKAEFYENSVNEHDSKYDLNSYYKLKQFTHLENFRTQTFEYCTMPLTVENSASDLDQKINAQNLSSPTNTIIGNGLCENDNRTTQTSVTEGAVNSVSAIAEHYELENNGSADGESSVTDLQCIYPMPAFAGGIHDIAEDFCETDINCYPQSAVVAVPNGGALYYMYNQHNSIPGLGNIYMQGGQPPMTVPPSFQQPVLNAYNNLNTMQNCFYYTTTPYCSPSPDTLYQPVQHNNNLPAACSNIQSCNTTSLNGKINLEAKRSLKANGIDLPTDVATLRYFYNLGLDYFHIKQNQKNINNSPLNTTNEVTKLDSEMEKLKLEERKVRDEVNIPDNNNNLTNSNQSSIEANQNQDQKSAQSATRQTRYNNNFQRRHMRERYISSNQFQRGNGNDSIKNCNQAGGQYDTNNNFNMKFKNSPTINANRNNNNETQNLQEMVNNANNTSHSTNVGSAYEVANNNNLPIVSNFNICPNSGNNYGSDECTYDSNGKINNGVYIQMPLSACPPPYGLYQAPPPGIQNTTTNAAYVPSTGTLTNMPMLGAAPRAMNSGYYAPQSTVSDLTVDNRGVSGDITGMHYQNIIYPSPMPLFCTNMGGGIAAPNLTMPPPQSFWCIPPPPLPNTATPCSQQPQTPIRNTSNKSGGSTAQGMSYGSINNTSIDPPTSI